jgi:hypothetical protein
MELNQTIRESGEKVVTKHPEETPHFCYDGWVFLGYEGIDERRACRGHRARASS